MKSSREWFGSQNYARILAEMTGYKYAGVGAVNFIAARFPLEARSKNREPLQYFCAGDLFLARPVQFLHRCSFEALLFRAISHSFISTDFSF